MKKQILLAFIIAGIGCTKEIDSDLQIGVQNDGETNNAVTATTYLPLTAGTYWNYEAISGGRTSTSKFTVLNLKKNIKGKAYTGVRTESGTNSDTLFYNQTLHDYYLSSEQNTSGTQKTQVEVLFLKDNSPIGTKWSSAIDIPGLGLKYSGKIIGTNLTLNVSGKTYKNVIHSYVEISKKVLFTSIVISKQDFYVAQNIGIIKSISTTTYPKTSTSTSNITGYSIK